MTRKEVLIWALVIYAVNVPMAWLLALNGYGVAAVIVITLGSAGIWYLVFYKPID